MKRVFKNTWNALRAFFAEARRNNVGTYAAQSSFFLIISSVPLIMLLLMLVQYIVDVDETAILERVLALAPANITAFVTDLVQDLFNKQAIPLISFSAVMLLWSASRGVLSVMRGLRRVFRAESMRFYKERLIALLYTLALVLTLLIALLLLVFGDTLLQLLQSRVAGLQGATMLIVVLKFLLSALLIMLFSLLVYTAASPRSFPFRAQLPGALFSTAGWILFSMCFSVYINNFSNYSYIYGSLTAVILLMLWLYACMCLLFLGAQINHTLHKRRRDRAQQTIAF